MKNCQINNKLHPLIANIAILLNRYHLMVKLLRGLMHNMKKKHNIIKRSINHFCYKLAIFLINYRWSNHVSYIDGWIPKASLLIPILGYLILFNDATADFINFNTIANEKNINFGLIGNSRLKMIYFAFMFLGISNLWYRMRRPYQFRFGTDVMQYTRTALEVFKLTDYRDIHHRIRHEGHNTSGGKYYDSEWDGFIEAARNIGEGTGQVKHTGDWEKAKSKYGNLLRGILDDAYYEADTTRRVDLSFCLVLSTIGYILLTIPSGDLFIKILLTLF